MSPKSIPEQVAEIMSPDFGKPATLNDEDRRFIDEYEQAESQLDEEARFLSFKNVIRKEGRCGFASGGSIDYLINTDRHARYRVTVRTHWRSGNNAGQSDQIVISEAGGKKHLGCTDSGYIPVAYYSRQVVGEVKI